MPHRTLLESAEPTERAATSGDAYLFANAAIVGRACEAWLMAHDPNYAAERAANRARTERAVANRHRKLKP
jgi:hypothetical protein